MLDVLAFYGYTQGWDDEDIREQIIDTYDKSDTSNYSALDLTSIMMCVYPRISIVLRS